MEILAGSAAQDVPVYHIWWSTGVPSNSRYGGYTIPREHNGNVFVGVLRTQKDRRIKWTGYRH
jgi:hypothetical protein